MPAPAILALAGSGARALPVVSLSAVNKEDTAIVPGFAEALFRLEADGDTSEGPLRDWLVSGNPADCEARMSLVSGTFTTGTVGSWLPLSADRTWTVSKGSTAGFKQVSATLEIRDSITGQILGSCSVFLKATLTSGGGGGS